MDSCLAFNYSKLRGRIREKCGNNAVFAKKLGIHDSTLSQKLNNMSDFSQNEIFKSIRILELKESDIPDYFFVM